MGKNQKEIVGPFNIVAKRVSEARESLSLSEIQFSEVIGFPAGLIKSWESGEVQPSVDGLAAISNRTGYSVDYMLGLVDKNKGLDINQPLVEMERGLSEAFSALAAKVRQCEECFLPNELPRIENGGFVGYMTPFKESPSMAGLLVSVVQDFVELIGLEEELGKAVSGDENVKMMYGRVVMLCRKVRQKYGEMVFETAQVKAHMLAALIHAAASVVPSDSEDRKLFDELARIEGAPPDMDCSSRNPWFSTM